MSQITRVTSGIDLRINAKQFHLTYAACYTAKLPVLVTSLLTGYPLVTCYQLVTSW